MYKIAAFYHFALIKDPSATRERLKKIANALDLCGTTLVAAEGLNGTMAGSDTKIDAWLEVLRCLEGFSPLEAKFSYSEQEPFFRAKIKLKKQIITMGDYFLKDGMPLGRHLDAQDWNEVISDPETLVIDTRNDYEIKIGTFERAINPKTDNFGQFPQWVAENLDPKKHKKIAMFCTGGIRCEKSTAYMLEQGFEEVYHLKGGILKYLETCPKEQSKWQGECFVFDSRVSVAHGLQEGESTLCFACRMPLTPQDLQHECYEEGVACHHCHNTYSAEKRAAFRERHKQQMLAQSRNEKHLGKVLYLKDKTAQ